MSRKVIIHSDGSCLSNPGAGGWAAILHYYKDDELLGEKTIVGSVVQTTNNRMEIVAFIEALKLLKGDGLEVEVYTDSQYIITASQNVETWFLSNWIKKDGKFAANRDLWIEARPLLNQWKPKMIWVRGHDASPINRMVDALAHEAAEKVRG